MGFFILTSQIDLLVLQEHAQLMQFASIKFSCFTEVAGDPRRLATENMLTFTNMTTKDAQVIQCNVTNKYGYNFTNAYLNVLGKISYHICPIFYQCNIFLIISELCIVDCLVKPGIF